MDAAISNIITDLNDVGQAFWNYAAGIFFQASVLIIVLLAADLLLRKRVRAVFRYCVWMLVFVKLLLPTSFALPTGIGYWLGDFSPVEYSAGEDTAAMADAVPPVIAQPDTDPTEAVLFEPPTHEALPVRAGKIGPIETVTSAAGMNDAPAKIKLEAVTWQGLVFLGWLTGMLVFSVSLVQRACFVRGLLAQAKPAQQELCAVLNRCRVDMGIRTELGLKISDAMSSPAVCGLIRPTILLPRYLVEKLSEDKLRVVLLHECAHIRRWDLWVNLLQTVLQIVYFYNPFLWLANARVRCVREQAVDETVLVALRGQSETYSDTLIDIGEMAFWRPNFSLRLIGVVESKKALAERIKYIAHRPIPKTAKLGIVGSIAVILIAAVLLPMARADKTELGPNSAREDRSESTVAADMLDAITQPTPHPPPALWIYEANSELARLARAIAGEDLKSVGSKSVSSAGHLLASYFRQFKRAVMVDDWLAQLASQGEIDEKKDRRIREYEGARDTLAACVSGEQGIEEILRLASELEGLSGELQEAATDDKLYLVPAIYEELERKWKDFRATLRLGSIDRLGLVAFWKFDEHAGSTAYDMAGNNDGTIHGAQSFNGGLRFDGRDDYVSIPDFHLAEFSFSVWLQPLDLSDNRRIFLLDDGDCFYAIHLNSRGGVGFGASTAAGETDWGAGVNEYDWRLAEDKWTHIVVTYDGRTVNIYKDGELTESGTGEFIKSVRGTAYIGGTDKYRGQFWHGVIDEVAIFNRPLTVAEVNRLHTAMPRVNTKVTKTIGGWSAPVKLGPAINTEYDENYPYLSADGRSLYFNSNRPGGFGGADIYVARKVDGLWQRPENLGPVVNSAANEAGPMLSCDGKYLFFCSDRMAGPSTMLFVSKIVDGRFHPPEPLPYFINSALHTDEPFLTADGEMLYFQTFGRDGNIKIRDLWCSRFSAGEFERPVNLGPLINRFPRQKSPSLTADGRYLYYIYEMADKRTGIVVSEKVDRNFIAPIELKFPSLAELRMVEPTRHTVPERHLRRASVKDETHDTRDIVWQQEDRYTPAREIETRRGESDPAYPRGYIDSAKISWTGRELYFSMKDSDYDIWCARKQPRLRPARPPRNEWVDILELIDVERDAKGGDWRREDGTLIGFAQSTLQTSYELPAEYDVLWEFSSNSTAINLLLASPLGKRFEWMMKGWSHRLCGIRDVDCKPVNANETTTTFPMESGVRYVAEVKVRKDRFIALINGKEILNYKTDWSNIEVCTAWHPFELQGRRLGLWLNKHWTRTYSLKVRPHRGVRAVADNLIVPGTRVGEYAIGISKDDVLKSLGKPRVIFYSGEKYTLDNLPRRYFMVYDDIAFGVVGDSVEGVSALSSLYKFANGLGVGDSEQKIKQAFGDNYRFKETEGKDFLTYDDHGIQFEIQKDNRTVMEISVFRKTGQRPAGPKWVASDLPDGTGGYALDFDGVDDFVQVPRSESLEPETEITVEMWAFLEPRQKTNARLLRKAGAMAAGYLLAADQTGDRTIQFRIDRNAAKVGIIRAADSRPYDAYVGAWHHFAGVYNSTHITLYIDGVEINTVYHDKGGLVHSPVDLYIGHGAPGPDEFFRGRIDEVRVWIVARTGEQIQADMHRRLVGDEPGLAAYWDFDEGEGEIVHDSSPYSNHGKLRTPKPPQHPAHPLPPVTTKSVEVETVLSQERRSGESQGLVASSKFRIDGVDGYSDAKLGEWDGKGKPEMFLIREGKLLVIGADGELLYQAVVGGVSLDLVADVDDDGKDEIFVSWSQGENLNIAVLDKDMKEVKKFKAAGCPHPGHERSTFTALALVDLDNDGKKELLAKVETGYCLKPRGICCFDSQSGQLLWSHLIGPSPMPPLVVLDVNGDGKLDVVFGSYSPGTGSSQDDGTDDMHCYVHAVSHRGELLWVRELGGHYTATYPVAGDIDGDGDKDIIVRVQGNPDFRSEIGRLVRLDNKGNVAASFDAGATLYSCSVEDLEGDGTAEVIATDCRGSIYVLNADLEVIRKKQLGSTEYESIIPVISDIADLGRDGAREIILTYAEREFVSGRNPRTDGGPRNVRYYHNNSVLALEPSLEVVGRYLVADQWKQHPGFSVILGDLDADGILEILSLTDEAAVLELQ